MATAEARMRPMGRRKKKTETNEQPPQAEQPPKPRPGYPLFARIDESLGSDLERFLDAQRLRPTMTAVIETALKDFLRAEGFLTEKPKKEGGDK
jgi:hypothetical protein